MKLSIVIALYNTEKYISRCIMSIYEKNTLSLDEFEVIVINDGSSDNSGSIVESLQKVYSNIILINKKNEGQSIARNIGFGLAKGDYIYCLDSDDYIDSNALCNALFFAVENNLDLLPIDFILIDESNNRLEKKKDNYYILNQVISGGEFMMTFIVSGAMWRYLYKTEIIKKYNLRLLEGVYHEDEEFVMKFLAYSKRILYNNHLVYYYMKRLNSTVNNKEIKHKLKLLRDIVTIINSLDCLKKTQKYNSFTYQGLDKKVNQLTISVLLRLRKLECTFLEKTEILDELEKQQRFPVNAKNLKINQKIFSFFMRSFYLRRMFLKF